MYPVNSLLSPPNSHQNGQQPAEQDHVATMASIAAAAAAAVQNGLTSLTNESMANNQQTTQAPNSAGQIVKKRGRPPKSRQSLPMGSPAQMSNGTPLNSPMVDGSQEKPQQGKRARHTDDHLLAIPFDLGWSRFVRFRWQAPGQQILSEVTYKSPSGRIFRSYAKINEYLVAEQNAPHVNNLTPENFSFAAKARIAGTTFQKTTTGSQGFKEYREMTSDDVDLLFVTMADVARNKTNPIPIYEQIFGAYQIPEDGVIAQDFSTASLKNNQVNGNQPAVADLSMPTVHRTSNHTEPPQSRHFSASAMNLLPIPPTVPAVPNAGSNDEQQAMLMFMTAMFMQQQQQQQQQLSASVLSSDESKRTNSVPLVPMFLGNENLSVPAPIQPPSTVKDEMLSKPVCNEAKSMEFPQNLVVQSTVTEPVKQLEPVVPLVEPVATDVPTTAKMSQQLQQQSEKQDKQMLKVQKRKKFQQERRAKLAEIKHELNKQPTDDMLLIQRKQLPELPRFAEYSYLADDNQAIADCFQVFEFVQTFANVLGLDVNGLPSLASLERGIAAVDRQSLLEVTDLLCRLVAIGIQDASGWLDGAVSDLTTMFQNDYDEVVENVYDDSSLWQQLPKLPVDRITVSEVCRQFLLVRQPGRHIEEADELEQNYFQTMKPRHRARILAAICDELLGYHCVLEEIEKNLSKSIDLKRDLQGIQQQLKGLHQPIPAAKIDREVQPSGNDGNEKEKDGDEEGEDAKNEPMLPGGPTEEETATNEKLVQAEIKKLTRQEKNCKGKLFEALSKVRASHLGFDRFDRSYWALPHVGAVLVHAHDLNQQKPFVEENEIEEQQTEEPEQSKPTEANNEEIEVGKEVEEEKGDQEMDVEQEEKEVVDVGSEPGSSSAPEPVISSEPNEEIKPKMPVVETPLNNDSLDESTSDEDSSEMDDEVESARWSPPAGENGFFGIVGHHDQQQQPPQNNSPKLPRQRKGQPKKQPINQEFHLDSGAMDLSAPTAPAQPLQPPTTTTTTIQQQPPVVEPNVVTIDPVMILQQFLLFAKMSGMNSASAMAQEQTSVMEPAVVEHAEAPTSALKDPLHPIDHQHLKVRFQDEMSNTAGNDETNGEAKPATVIDDDNGKVDEPIVAVEEEEEESEEENAASVATREILFETPQLIPMAMQFGWWRLEEKSQIESLVNSLNHHGVRERNLQRNISKSMDRIENVLTKNQSSVNRDEVGEFFTKNASTDEHNEACDLEKLQKEIENEAFQDIANAVSTATSIGVKPVNGRGRPKKNQIKTVNVQMMPEIDDDFDKNLENVDESERFDEAKKNLVTLSYLLASRKMLQPPFEVIPLEEPIVSENEQENEITHRFSDAFLKYVEAVQRAGNWSALKLRLLQLEQLSNLNFAKGVIKAESETNIESVLRQLIDCIREHDDVEPFLYPVSRSDYPMYYELIESPMDLQTIENKIKQNCYRSISDFASDVRLMVNNCHQFNANGSEIYEKATRLKRFFERKLKQI